MKYPGQIRIVGGKLRGRKIPVLSMESLRPTPDRVRETLFNWLQGRLTSARCLDFFAGTGILGFEALSRGAKEVVMVDAALTTVEVLKKTRETLGLREEECMIVWKDAREWIKTYQGPAFDLVFLDPPFQSTLLEECLTLLLESKLLSHAAKIYVEYPIEKQDPIIEGFEQTKAKKAGMVAYCLYERI